jgi:hypothetical protein
MLNTSGDMAHCEIPNKEGWPKAPAVIYYASGLKFHPSEKANAIADCLETQFTHHLCDENHYQRVGARVQALLETVNNTPQWI